MGITVTSSDELITCAGCGTEIPFATPTTSMDRTAMHRALHHAVTCLGDRP
jgi:hypothetical protein